MGKEILTGLVEEDAKRGFEKARSHVRDENGGSLSITGLLEATGLALKSDLESLLPIYDGDESALPAMKLVVSLEPRRDDPRSEKYFSRMSGTPHGVAQAHNGSAKES